MNKNRKKTFFFYIIYWEFNIFIIILLSDVMILNEILLTFDQVHGKSNRKFKLSHHFLIILFIIHQANQNAKAKWSYLISIYIYNFLDSCMWYISALYQSYNIIIKIVQSSLKYLWSILFTTRKYWNTLSKFTDICVFFVFVHSYFAYAFAYITRRLLLRCWLLLILASIIVFFSTFETDTTTAISFVKCFLTIWFFFFLISHKIKIFSYMLYVMCMQNLFCKKKKIVKMVSIYAQIWSMYQFSFLFVCTKRT